MQRLPLSSSLGHAVVAATRQLLDDEAFVHSHRMNEKSFTRRRQLTFSRLCVLIVQKTVRSLQAHLTDFFGWLESGTGRPVSASAFSQARAKLKHTAFIELNERAILAQVYAPEQAAGIARWHAFRLIGIDSSLVRVPNNQELGDHFGWVNCRNQSGVTRSCVQLRLSIAYDLLNQLGLQTLVDGPARGERQVALEHLQRLEAQDLAVLDRGYASYELFARFIQADRHFVCRCERHTFSAAQELFEGNEPARSVVVKLSNPVGHAPHLPATITVRLVTVALPKGQLEVLATSLLDATAYPTTELALVYGARWGIETYYGRLKGRLDLQHFSGLTLAAILQDIHATVYLSNLEMVLIGPAQTQLSAAAKVNHAVAFHTVKRRMIDLLLSDQPVEALTAEMTQCFLRNAHPHRPNRSAPRLFSPSAGYHFQRNLRKSVY